MISFSHNEWFNTVWLAPFYLILILALLALVTLVAKATVEWRMKKETEMLNTVLAPEKT